MIIGKRHLPFRYPMGSTIGKEHVCGISHNESELFYPMGMELLLTSKVDKFKVIEHYGSVIVERLMFAGSGSWDLADVNSTVTPFVIKYIDPSFRHYPMLVTVKQGIKKLWNMFSLNKIGDCMYGNEIVLDAVCNEAAREYEQPLVDILERFGTSYVNSTLPFFNNEVGMMFPSTDLDYPDHHHIPGKFDATNTVSFAHEMLTTTGIEHGYSYVEEILGDRFAPKFGRRHDGLISFAPDKLTRLSRDGGLSSRYLYRLATPESERGILSQQEDLGQEALLQSWHAIEWNGLVNPALHDLATFVMGSMFTDFQIKYILQPCSKGRINVDANNYQIHYLVNRYFQQDLDRGSYNSAGANHFEFMSALPGFALRWADSVSFQLMVKYGAPIVQLTLTKTWDEELFLELGLADGRKVGFYVDLPMACVCSPNLSNIDYGDGRESFPVY